MLWNFHSETESHALPYEWPDVNFSPPGRLAEFINDVLHQSAFSASALGADHSEAGDREERNVWPFRTPRDYESAGAPRG
jgi:hypothetical protein